MKGDKVKTENKQLTQDEVMKLDEFLAEAGKGEEALRNQYFMQLGVKNFLASLKNEGCEIVKREAEKDEEEKADKA